MKASKVFLGMKLKKSCKNTVIRNCLLDKGHGGIVIGSEMSGGVKDMVVSRPAAAAARPPSSTGWSSATSR